MNWGTKVVLGMISFMLFIVGMVVYMFKMHGNDALVDDNYYEKGINYDVQYKALQQVITDAAAPELQVTKSQLIIMFKDSAAYQLKLLRVSDQKSDLRYTGKTIGTHHIVVMDRQKIKSGLWMLELNWVSKDKNYLFKKSLSL